MNLNQNCVATVPVANPRVVLYVWDGVWCVPPPKIDYILFVSLTYLLNYTAKQLTLDHTFDGYTYFLPLKVVTIISIRNDSRQKCF